MSALHCWEYGLGSSTDRRPNPNAAESGSLTAELSLPSLRYRSGWNSMGSLKALGSCNIDLKKLVQAHKKNRVIDHALAITSVPFGI